MRQQMKAAGIIPAEERIATIALAAAKAFPKDWAKAGKQVEATVFGDLGLTLEYTRDFHKEATRRVLEVAYKEIRTAHAPGDTHARAGSAGSGHGQLDDHKLYAAPAPSPDAGDASKILSQDQTNSAPPASGPSEIMKKVVRLTLMDTLRTPLGQPYGEANLKDLGHALAVIPRKQGELVFHQRLIPRLMNKMGPEGTVKDQIPVEEFDALKRVAENVNDAA